MNNFLIYSYIHKNNFSFKTIITYIKPKYTGIFHIDIYNQGDFLIFIFGPVCYLNLNFFEEN